MNAAIFVIGDVDHIHRLIVELAVYEREPEAVKTTPQQLLEDGFGDHPFFHSYVVDRIDHESTLMFSPIEIASSVYFLVLLTFCCSI